MKIKSSSKMTSVGGYLEIQLPKGVELYPSLLKLNTGRNAFEYILKVRRYKLVYIPYFTCEVILEPLKKLGIQFKYYIIDEQMNPVLDIVLGPEDCLLYTNYFGLKQETVVRLCKLFANLIIDNSQAFFTKPLDTVDTFYSCRKFFGVPDGAYLQCKSDIKLKLIKDISIDRFSHLIKSVDLGIEHGYNDFIVNDISLSNLPIKRMSVLSQRLLSGIDYMACKHRRNSNFLYLHDYLEKYNDFSFDVASVNGPMVYPFLTSCSEVRNKLLEKKIYVASYWPNVLKWTTRICMNII